MSYLNRVWMAASGAAKNDHADQGQTFSYGLKSLRHAKERFSAGPDSRPLAGLMEAGGGGEGEGLGYGGMDEKRRQVEDSLRHVMYLNCWGLN